MDVPNAPTFVSGGVRSNPKTGVTGIVSYSHGVCQLLADNRLNLQLIDN